MQETELAWNEMTLEEQEKVLDARVDRAMKEAKERSVAAVEWKGKETNETCV